VVPLGVALETPVEDHPEVLVCGPSGSSVVHQYFAHRLRNRRCAGWLLQWCGCRHLGVVCSGGVLVLAVMHHMPCLLGGCCDPALRTVDSQMCRCKSNMRRAAHRIGNTRGPVLHKGASD
jgi:hypothetical protein